LRGYVTSLEPRYKQCSDEGVALCSMSGITHLASCPAETGH
jgi:hypothetical protein